MMNQKNPHSKWIEQIKVMMCSQRSISKGIMVPDKSLLLNESSANACDDLVVCILSLHGQMKHSRVLNFIILSQVCFCTSSLTCMSHEIICCSIISGVIFNPFNILLMTTTLRGKFA